MLDKRALVVDDEEDIRILLRGLLAVKGWSVDQACDGHEALARTATESYDLIVLDQRMPGLTGIETALRLREDSFRGPIIFYSAYVTPDFEESIRSEVGEENFVVSKTDIEDFVNLIHRLGDDR